MITKNFGMGEMSCNCGCDAHLAPSIKDNIIKWTPWLQRIRDHFGVPISINSAVRCPRHNGRVGGSPRSQHLRGLAFDLHVHGIDPGEVASYIEGKMDSGDFPPGGVGRYDTFTHVDFRGRPARWDYRSS